MDAWVLWAALLAANTAAPEEHLERQAADEASVLHGLEAEIAAYEDADISADPAHYRDELLALWDRVEADGSVPVQSRVELAAAIGTSLFYLREYDASLEWNRRGLDMLEGEGGSEEDRIQLMANRASLLTSLARFDEAEAVHREVMAARSSLYGEDSVEVSSSLFNLGIVLYRKGRYDDGVDMVRRSVEIHEREVGEGHAETVLRMASLGAMMVNAGREAEAVPINRRAEALGREHLGDDHPTYSTALNNLGFALISSGRYGEALPVMREALRVRIRTVGEDDPRTAYSLRNLSSLLKVTGKVDEGETLNARALAIFEASGETEAPEVLGYMYSDMADYAARRDDESGYREWSERAIAHVDSNLPETSVDRAHVMLYHARWLGQRGDTGEALTLAKRWVPVMQAGLSTQHKDRIWAELLLARLLAESGDIDAMREIADDASARLADKLASFAISDGQLAREARTHLEATENLIAAAVVAGDQARIFAGLQLYNITALSVSQEYANVHASEQSEAARVRNDLRLASARVDRLQSRADAALEDGSEPGEAGATELAEAQAERDALRERLLADYPDHVLRYRPSPVPLAGFLEAMDGAEMIVAPVETPRTSWLVTITSEGLSTHEIDGESVRKRVSILRDAVQGPGGEPFPLADAHALYRELFPDGIGADRRLVSYGGGALASLPLGLLPSAPHEGDLRTAPWLLRDASVQVTGNLSLYLAQKSKAAAPSGATRSFAGIGGAGLPGEGGESDRSETQPVFAALFRSGRPAAETIADLPALSFAEAELGRIAAALPGEDIVLVGADAAEERVKRTDLSQTDVIAFATHGLVAGELRDLWEPALLLGTQEDSGEDGLLGASEIARLDLNADWVILSACNTAAGEERGAPVYSGLATAFAQAGARALMLSHWRVRDDAAARLTVDTVRGTAGGLSRAEALRRAQLALMADETVPDAAHPSIWAPFVIIEN